MCHDWTSDCYSFSSFVCFCFWCWLLYCLSTGCHLCLLSKCLSAEHFSVSFLLCFFRCLGLWKWDNSAWQKHAWRQSKQALSEGLRGFLRKVHSFRHGLCDIFIGWLKLFLLTCGSRPSSKQARLTDSFITWTLGVTDTLYILVFSCIVHAEKTTSTVSSLTIPRSIYN